MSDVATLVIDLAKNGIPPRDIRRADGVGKITTGRIYAIIKDARARGVAIPRFSTRGLKSNLSAESRAVLFADSTMQSLKHKAVERGITTNELIRRLIETIDREILVDAILDDGAV